MRPGANASPSSSPATVAEATIPGESNSTVMLTPVLGEEMDGALAAGDRRFLGGSTAYDMPSSARVSARTLGRAGGAMLASAPRVWLFTLIVVESEVASVSLPLLLLMLLPATPAAASTRSNQPGNR